MSTEYDVVLTGVMDGFDEQQAHADFATLFSLAADKVAQIFANKPTVLKSGVDEHTAQKYTSRLASIGVAATTAAAGAGLGLVEKVPDSSASAAEAVAEDDYAVRREAFSFTGNGFEYFKIWIVNLLLNIITLGIYSAWAKVRNKQYFYGNMHIAGTAFEYTAEPLKILKGRLIAVGLYIALGVSGHISPIANIIMALVFLVFMPWIIVSSLRFNARHTSYRNIPFRFHGGIGGAVKAFILWPLLGIFTLGIMLPFAWKRQAQYVTNNHAYGTERFEFDVGVSEYYKMLLFMFVIAAGFMVVMGVLVGGSFAVLAKAGGHIDPSQYIALIPAVALYLVMYLVLGAYVVVTLNNIHFNNTCLQKHQFQSNWNIFSFMGLLVTNTLGILFTLGLFTPFAKVRTAAYRAEHLSLMVMGNLDNFIAQEQEQAGSLGEGVHDIFDIDISL